MKYLLLLLLAILFLSFKINDKENVFSLKNECIKNLYILCNDLTNLQKLDSTNANFGALYCESCSNYHTRASESILPFAVAYKESGNEQYFNSALLTGRWLVEQQKEDGSWFETPDTWTGTTTDQLLSLAVAYSVLKSRLSKKDNDVWSSAIKKAADWLVINMNHQFASINYCATTTATLSIVHQLLSDTSYLNKAKDLASVVMSKFDSDYFLTGEGNRIRGTKYGVDLGYNMDMSLWGLGLYAQLNRDEFVNSYVEESLKRHIYFIYPDGSTDNSWGVRSSKWTTYGSFTADGCQILFGLYSKDNPVYRNAALSNLNYLMSMRENGLITYGPNYYEMYNDPPCIYPTFCRAKNLALAILYGDQTEDTIEDLPTQKIGWARYFKTLNLVLVRTKNFMTTITGYWYKDIRRGSDFKYMFRPTGGSITNLWVQDYGYLQASSQTVYQKWEMNYPEVDTSLTLTPRIEFDDSNAYYTNLYEFDSHIEVSDSNGIFFIEAIGELKDKNRWEGGVAYILTHKIADDYIEKKIQLRFHGQKPTVSIIEPFIQNRNTTFNRINPYTIEITDGSRKFLFELLTKEYPLEIGTDEDKYDQPFPSLKGYPFIIKVKPDGKSFLKELSYRIKIKT